MAQEWIVTVKVTTATVEDVRPLDVKEAVEELLEDFDGGTAQVIDVQEQP